jgi:hypothetical protein
MRKLLSREIRGADRFFWNLSITFLMLRANAYTRKYFLSDRRTKVGGPSGASQTDNHRGQSGLSLRAISAPYTNLERF